MAKTILIIGAGLSGLSAGISLQKKGYMTQIFESAPWAGGACASWIKDGFVFDAGMHYLLGTKKGEPLYRMYQSVQALDDDIKVHYPKELVVEVNQHTYTLPLNAHGLYAYFIKHFPEEAPFLKVLFDDLHAVSDVALFVHKPTLKDYKNFLYYKATLKRLKKRLRHVNVEEYMRTIADPTLKQLLSYLIDPQDDVLNALLTSSQYFRHNRGIPEQGSKGVISRMEALYRGLGGRIHFNARVEKIMVQSGKVEGLMVGGLRFDATHVIASNDAYQTLTRLLVDQVRHPLWDESSMNKHTLKPFVIVSLGLNRRFNFPSHGYFESTPGIFSGFHNEHNYLVRSYDYEKTYQKPNQSVVMVFVSTLFEEWTLLQNLDKEAYKALKEKVRISVIETLKARYKGIEEAIVTSDVSTPATYDRLFHYDHLSLRNYNITQYAPDLTFPHKVKGVKNVFLCGQSITKGGGIALAVKSGIDAANLIK